MRQLYLVNGVGTTYFFDYRSQTLISSISDLGFSKNLTYVSYENSYKLVKSKNPQSSITLGVIFLKGYQGYNDFLSFIRKSSTNLRLFYKYDDSSKYCIVTIKSITKTELESGVIKSTLVLDKLSLWLNKVTYTINVNQGARGKEFPYYYPFTYSASFNGTINVTNSGEEKAPLFIEINGTVKNPEVEIIKNSVTVSKLRLLVTQDDCIIHVNSEPTDQHMVMITHDGMKNIYKNQDFTCDNFLFLDRGTYQIKFTPGVSENTTCRITVIEGYSGH